MTQVAPSSFSLRAPLPLVALGAPDTGMPLVARVGRVRWPLLFCTLCAVAFGAAQAARVDGREQALRQLEMQGRLQQMSDRQVEDQQKAAERVFMVKKLARGLFEAPAEILASAGGLLILSWFLRGRAVGGQLLAVSAYAALPSGLANLAQAGATLMFPSIGTEAQPPVPTTLGAIAGSFGARLGPIAGKLLGAFDVFSLWGAVMLAFGLATAAQLPVRRAVAGTLIAWVCYRLLRFVVAGA